MKRKMISFFLATAMLLGTLSGCGSQSAQTDAQGTKAASAQPLEIPENPDDWPVIAVQSLSYDMPDEEMIEEALNEYLISINAGAKVDLVGINFGDLATQMTLMLSDKQNPLISSAGGSIPILTAASRMNNASRWSLTGSCIRICGKCTRKRY